MASSLQKLLRKPLRGKSIFSSLNTQQAPNPTTVPLFLNHSIHIETRPDLDHRLSEFLPPRTENVTHFSSKIFYPSFPFGFFLDPIVSTGSINSEPDEGVPDGGSRTVWADSVKKKRKKKMNKHKYKKLRKRLRGHS